MELAVAAESALGQYLMELETVIDDESMTQVPDPVARKRSGRNEWSPVSRTLSVGIRRCMEVVAMQRLMIELCAFYPTIREDLRQAVGTGPAVFAAPSKWWWKRQFAVVEVLRGVDVVVTEEMRRFIAVIAGALAATIAILVAGRHVDLLQILGWVVGLATFLLLGLELSVRMLLAWYRCRSRRLVASLNAFIAALKAFEKVFARSLTLMKRAELASRGYRLGTGVLPPIGRLEASNFDAVGTRGKCDAVENQLRCLPLRRKLRAVNEQLQIQALIIVKKGGHTTRDKIHDSVGEEAIVGDHAPSLLLTALTKQHNRSVLLLENAVHAVLVRNLTCACSYRGDAVVSQSLFHTLGSYRLTVEHLIDTLSTWMDDLEAWNTSGDPMVLLAGTSDTKSSHQQQEKQHVAFSVASDIHLKGAASQLQELRSTSEALTALVVAAQCELLSADSAAERLASSRDVMRSMTEQLHEAWSSYDCALSALTGREDHSKGTSGDAANKDEGARDSDPIAPLELSSVIASEDPNCTVVFTGTSTGDDGFDLQAMLKQKEGDATAASNPTAHFVRELRDVLANRQVHAHPGRTKQVDHDPPVLLTPAPPSPPAADAMFALPRAPPRRRPRRSPFDSSCEVTPGAFNLELEALLQGSQVLQENVIECLGDEMKDAVLDAEGGERFATPSSGQSCSH